MKPARWYAISKAENSASGGSVEISIYDEIGFGGVSAKDFLAEVQKFSGQHIDLRINSVGGSVTEGAAIYNALRRHQGGLTVHVDGLAASMASVIAMAGDKTLVADNALLMIHNPWSISMGDAETMRKEAAVLDKIKSTLVNAYTRKTGMDAATIGQMMDAETWLDSTEAVAMGFADGIEDGLEAAASVTRDSARARFDKLTNLMARKPSKSAKADEAVIVDDEPTTETAPEPTVDTPSEDVTAELTAKVEALQADVDAKNALLAQASEDTAKEIESLKLEVARLSSEVAQKNDEIAALNAEKKSAGEQAAQIVASIGLNIPTATAPVEPELSAAQHFATLEGSAQVNFYRANKAAILKTFYS
jgi:ATP-dependent protease ClpP protease subunit